MDKQRFTSRQLTTMVVAVCTAIVLAPLGAVAATTSLVNITDPANPKHKARVTSEGQMVVRSDPGVPARPFASDFGGVVTVPEKRGLVVETVSVQCAKTNASGNVEAFIRFRTKGQEAELFLTLHFAYYENSTGYYFYADTESVRLYADAGSSITVDCYAGANGNMSPNRFMTVSGHLA